MKIKNALNSCEKYTFSQNYGIIKTTREKRVLQVKGAEEKAGIIMEINIDRASDVDSWKEVMLIYNSALKQVETKLEVLNDEFQHVHRYNPIEHIKSRIKTSESIVKKLKKNGYESTISNMIQRERYCGDQGDLFLYVGYLPCCGYDKQPERHQDHFRKGLYYAPESQRLQELSYDRYDTGLFV